METNFVPEYIPYFKTGKFTKIVQDYVAGSGELRQFYRHQVNMDGVKSAIAARRAFTTNRKLLVEQLRIQYQGTENYPLVLANIESLLDENTFTICTAHQPNIFTGHLYFIYKIMHVIKLADQYKKELPGYHFVPVFFMGSEDADLEELNHVVIDGEKYTWNTQQTGAVGRMKIDDDLLNLIRRIGGRLRVENYGSEIIDLLSRCYRKNSTIEEATFLFVHELFREYGLVVLLPDNAAYKREMIPVFENDLFDHSALAIVNQTSENIGAHYKAQAFPREINLFYLKDDIRNRIVAVDDHFVVHDTELVFSKEEMQEELRQHPERFSPNVILRGLFQEVILPDIAFVGGGGELAYWLQLQDLFTEFGVPYPLLILRNSFLLIPGKYQKKIKKLGFTSVDLFDGKEQLMRNLVAKETPNKLSLAEETKEIRELYHKIKEIVGQIDTTLLKHTDALKKRQENLLSSLEKKMIRAEKRKFAAEQNQLQEIFEVLFPHDGLQERTENFMFFYAVWGRAFLQAIYTNSLALEQEFCVITEK